MQTIHSDYTPFDDHFAMEKYSWCSMLGLWAACGADIADSGERN